jgi:hypothetical protein
MQFWSLVLGTIAPLFPYFLWASWVIRAANAESGMYISPWAPFFLLGPLAGMGLGLLGAVISGLLRDWPRRNLHRFLLGAGIGTALCVAGQFGLFQRN